MIASSQAADRRYRQQGLFAFSVRGRRSRCSRLAFDNDNLLLRLSQTGQRIAVGVEVFSGVGS